MVKRTIAAAALALLSTAGGGVVPEGMGAWVSSGRGIIPSSSTIQRYRYDGSFDAVWRDRIMYAVASVDYELPGLRLLYSLGDSPSPYQVHFDLDDSPSPPECSDEIAGNCIVARTTCGVGGEYVGTAYRVCSMLRVQVYVNRIAAVAVHQGLDEPTYAHAVLRHEVGHVLGLPEEIHLDSPCARALLTSFVASSALAEWTYLPKPAECL